MRLYKLTENYNQLLDIMIEESGEDELLKETLESIEEAIEQKAENMAKLIKTLEANSKVFEEEEKRLNQRKTTLKNKANYLKTFLQEQLEKAGKKKIQGSLLTISLQKTPPSVNILDETKIPADYMIPQPARIDKKGILEYLKNGNTLDGVEIKQGESLRIR